MCSSMHSSEDPSKHSLRAKIPQRSPLPRSAVRLTMWLHRNHLEMHAVAGQYLKRVPVSRTDAFWKQKVAIQRQGIYTTFGDCLVVASGQFVKSGEASNRWRRPFGEIAKDTATTTKGRGEMLRKWANSTRQTHSEALRLVETNKAKPNLLVSTLNCYVT